ncbi:MAG: hypothetical protein P1U39_06260 [Legionellaceae bacterium]|nr:hypothetical protein [Legionellaceae bacterium]
MPISRDILERLRNNDPSLVHLDLTSQINLYSGFPENRYHIRRDDISEQLTNEDIVMLGEVLTHNNYLKSLVLNKNQVGRQGVSILASTRLEKLAIRQNGLNSECIDELMLSETLWMLDVAGNFLKDEDIEKLAQNPRFTTLDVSDNYVGPLSMATFASNTTLTKLVIQETRFTEHRQQRYIDLEPLRSNTTLICLEICKNWIPTLNPLSGHPALEMLNLEGCRIGDHQIDASNLRPLLQIPKLAWLSICKTEDRGLMDTDHVAQLLADLPLSYLDVSKTEMSALGAKALAKSRTLTTLIASNNYIGRCGLIALTENKTIEKLDISQNNTDIASSKFVARERNEEEIWQGRDCIDYSEAESARERIHDAFMCAFEQNKTLKVFNMSKMRFEPGLYITDEFLANIIKNTVTLESLDISHWAYEVSFPILDALAENKTLKKVSFSCDLNREDNRLALSENFSLRTIRCYRAYDRGLIQQPYAQEIQERNRHFFVFFVLMLHAIEPKKSKSRVIDNIDLLCHIGSFLVPNHIRESYLHALTVFNRRIDPMERSSKKMRIEDLLPQK